jgi:hypothetical protein
MASSRGGHLLRNRLAEVQGVGSRDGLLFNLGSEFVSCVPGCRRAKAQVRC